VIGGGENMPLGTEGEAILLADGARGSTESDEYLFGTATLLGINKSLESLISFRFDMIVELDFVVVVMAVTGGGGVPILSLCEKVDKDEGELMGEFSSSLLIFMGTFGGGNGFS
jgi:hypothetical protein